MWDHRLGSLPMMLALLCATTVYGDPPQPIGSLEDLISRSKQKWEATGKVVTPEPKVADPKVADPKTPDPKVADPKTHRPLAGRLVEAQRLLQQVLKAEDLKDEEVQSIAQEMIELDLPEIVIFLAPYITGGRHPDGKRKLAWKVASQFVSELAAEKHPSMKLGEPAHKSFRAWCQQRITGNMLLTSYVNKRFDEQRQLMTELYNTDNEDTAKSLGTRLIQSGEDYVGFLAIDQLIKRDEQMEPKAREKTTFVYKQLTEIAHFFLGVDVKQRADAQFEKRGKKGQYLQIWRQVLDETRLAASKSLKDCPYNQAVLAKNYQN